MDPAKSTKNYHSIAAKKENVDQVLAAAEDAESAVYVSTNDPLW